VFDRALPVTLRIAADPGSEAQEARTASLETPVSRWNVDGVWHEAVLYDGNRDSRIERKLGDAILVDLNDDGIFEADRWSREYCPLEAPFQIGSAVFQVDSVEASGRAIFVREERATREPIQPASVGARAPDFLVQGMDGRVIRLSSLRGRVVLLSFWVSWCDECREKAPQLAAIYAAYHDRGLEILGVSYDTDRTAAASFQHEFQIEWPVEFTGRAFWYNPIGRAFRAENAGTVFLVNQDGILEGDFSDPSRLRARLEQMLPTGTGHP